MAKVNVPYKIDDLLGKATRKRKRLFRILKSKRYTVVIVVVALAAEYLLRHHLGYF